MWKISAPSHPCKRLHPTLHNPPHPQTKQHISKRGFPQTVFTVYTPSKFRKWKNNLTDNLNQTMFSSKEIFFFCVDIKENLVMATKSIRVIECGFNALKICIFLWWIIWNLENVEKIGALAANRCDVIYPKKCPHRLWKYRAEILHVVHKRRLNFALLGISAFANLSIACQLANVNHQIHKVVM